MATSPDADAPIGESIFWTCTDILTLIRHGVRFLAGPRERIPKRFRLPRRSKHLNHQLARPTRALVSDCA